MSLPTPERPALRPVEIVPVRTEHGSAVAMHDPQQIAPQPLVLSTGAVLVLEQLDGEHTLRDAQAEICRRTGHIVPMEQIENLVRALDEHLFLDSPRFAEASRALRDAFLGSPTRPATVAGNGYPAEPDKLRPFLDALFVGPGRPGLPERQPGRGDLRALVAPHIDLRRGGACFAHAYKALAEGSDADLFVILGIGHFGDARPYTLTQKAFETPLGLVPTDRDTVARLAELAPPDALGDEMGHRTEHSVEFAALFLRYLYPDRDDLAIVPVLCASFHPFVADNRRPIDQPEIRGFIDALRRVIAESGRKVCLIASVDLSHVGRRFGDERPADSALLRSVETHDRELLEAVAARDADALFRLIQQDQDSKHVCGTPAMYTLLHLLDGNESAALLRYEQSPEPEMQSAVTFAAMTFAAPE